MTYTYAVLEVSEATYDEIHRLLSEAGYGRACDEDGLISMRGIAIQRGKPTPPEKLDVDE
jgi:hypothetical protein